MPLDFDELRGKLNNADIQMQKNIGHLGTLAKDAERVRDIAKNAHIIISDIDKQFEEKTKLTNRDIVFLFFAVALQVVRQHIFSNDSFKLKKATQGDKFVGDNLKKIVKDKHWQDILLASVPYDAVHGMSGIGISGNTHRYRTLGHDPILGWIFGPISILSDSLTKTNFIDTYAVENMLLTGPYPGGTPAAINTSVSLIINSINGDDIEKKFLLPTALVKQALHFGSDYFTKHGLPIPLISTFGKTGDKISRELLTKYEINTYTIPRGAIIAGVINSIVSVIHKLFYNESIDESPGLYEVRTRKIISYSNILASLCNIVEVAVTKDIKKLDIGGFLITLYRIATDSKFISEIKQEFLEKEFYNIVMGDDFDF